MNIHSCVGAALARLEGRVALGTFLEFHLALSEPLEPRQGLHVHGPSRLPLRVKWSRS
jgi:cytochrome P450